MNESGQSDSIDELLRGKRVYALFYASWCPYSQKFLPVFQKYSSQTAESCIKVLMDDRDSLCEKYSIEVFPTVILFEDGKAIRRLDGKPRVGLSESDLKELLGKG